MILVFIVVSVVDSFSSIPFPKYLNAAHNSEIFVTARSKRASGSEFNSSEILSGVAEVIEQSRKEKNFDADLSNLIKSKNVGDEAVMAESIEQKKQAIDEIIRFTGSLGSEDLDQNESDDLTSYDSRDMKFFSSGAQVEEFLQMYDDGSENADKSEETPYEYSIKTNGSKSFEEWKKEVDIFVNVNYTSRIEAFLAAGPLEYDGPSCPRCSRPTTADELAYYGDYCSLCRQQELQEPNKDLSVRYKLREKLDSNPYLLIKDETKPNFDGSGSSQRFSGISQGRNATESTSNPTKSWPLKSGKPYRSKYESELDLSTVPLQADDPGAVISSGVPYSGTDIFGEDERDGWWRTRLYDDEISSDEYHEPGERYEYIIAELLRRVELLEDANSKLTSRVDRMIQVNQALERIPTEEWLLSIDVCVVALTMYIL